MREIILGNIMIKLMTAYLKAIINLARNKYSYKTAKKKFVDAVHTDQPNPGHHSFAALRAPLPPQKNERREYKKSP